MIILEIKEARETNPTYTQEDALTDSSDSTDQLDQLDQEDQEDQLAEEKEIESQLPEASASDPGNLYLLGDDVKKEELLIGSNLWLQWSIRRSIIFI